ncbi:PucR family transcriptional regulator ligand-binding domain-containing protein [Streptomyces sp. NPDC003720]|uniref:PucR family transcriptional regulator ligand-binding domain-containing protein n=1 Tax=Streptomyces sp. NPDC003720 TaxID=3364684 RepID=UPI0036A6E878
MPEPVAPAVPPTPPVALSALLSREDLALRQIAGPSGPSLVIHGAHTSEMADPYPYLLGGELLLTAGVHIPQAADADTYFDDYVSRIVAAGGAALGFGLAPVHDTVPPALIAACDARRLPLLEVPPRTTFSGVARAVWQLMAQARLAELRRVTDAQQSLAAAASRPDPVPSVLRQLAQRLGGHAILYGPDGTGIAEAGRAVSGEVRAALAKLTEVVRPSGPRPPEPDRGPEGGGGVGPSGADGPGAAGAGSARTGAVRPPADGAGGSVRGGQAGAARAAERASAHPPAGTAAPAGPGRSAAASAPAEPRRPAGAGPAAGAPAGPAPRPVPSSATDTFGDTHLAAYALGAGEGFVLGVASGQRGPGDHTIASVAAVLLSLLTGEHQSGSGAARSAALVRLLLGASPAEVAPLLGDGRWIVVHARPEAQAPDAVAASALGAALGSPLVDVARDVVRVLVPAEREPVPQPGWTLGTSAAAGPGEWPAADGQAARALARARATRVPLVRHGARQALADLVSHSDARAHADALLAPLGGRPALAETLRTWLSLHGSWDRTAVALDVHRNTVRQRIARCATLLDADLDDADVRMELWFALRQG